MRNAITRDGGEWTPGRVKRLFHRDARLTHVLRVTIRRHLARLEAEGVLDRHETPGRRYYTRSEGPRYDVFG
jgi:Fe2+ or Zn2+ uptake regulation protein